MVHETYKLINTIKKMYPVIEFLHNRYFPDSKVYYSEKALIETKRKGRKVAPFVVPVVGGIVMESEGYRAYEVEAPYIAPKMPITADELANKAFGEPPESGRTPAQRENEIQAEHMDDLRKAILRRIELMCSEILLTGKVLMKHFSSAEDAAKDINYSLKYLQFYEKEFQNHHSFNEDFKSVPASEKVRLLYEMAGELRKRGIKASDLLMTADVFALLLSDIEFLEFFNKAKVDIGDIKPEELPDGVICNGRININGVTLTMFVYDEQYEDLDGEVKAIFPEGTIAMLHPNIGETVYAQVTYVEGKGFKSHAEKIIPRLVADEKNNMVEVQTFSRPVPYPFDWDSWLVANINDEPVAKEDGKENHASQENDTGSAAKSSAGAGEGVSNDIKLKTPDEINAMTKKADVIAYAESIGLSGLNDGQRLDELKEAVLNYQEETYEEQGGGDNL